MALSKSPKVNITKINNKKFLLKIWSNGKRTRKTVNGSKTQAEIIKAQILYELNAGNFDILKKREVISLEQLIKEFLAQKKSHVRPSTLKRYTNYLDPFLGFNTKYFPEVAQDIYLFKTAYVSQFFIHIQDESDWKGKTLNGARECISSIFRYAIEEKYTEENPVKKIRKFPEVEKADFKFFTSDELKSIWKEVDTFWLDHLQFLYYTGLRKGEMINLTWDRVELKRTSPAIIIANSGDWKTKTGKMRTVPLNEKAVKIIERWKGKNKDLVFTDPSGNKIHPDRPYRALKDALKTLNIEGTVHSLRHSFAVKLIQSGVSVYEVMTLLGHSDIKMTQIYAKFAPDYLQSAVEKL